MKIFALTKPKKKLKCALAVVCFLLVLGVGVPFTYGYLKGEGAMASFAQVFGDEETIYVTDSIPQNVDDELYTAEIETVDMTGDPIKVSTDEKISENKEEAAKENGGKDTDSADKGETTADNNAKKMTFWQKILAVIFGTENEVIYYENK